MGTFACALTTICLVVLRSTAVDGAFAPAQLANRRRAMLLPTAYGVTGIPRGGTSGRDNGELELSVRPWIDSIQSPLWKSSAIHVVSDVVGFIVSLTTGSHVHLDLIGTGSFALAALPQIHSQLTHVRWSSLAQVLWASKLAGFLFFRAMQIGHDKRLDDTLSTVSGTYGFWFLTFVWQFVCSLPYTMGMYGTTSGKPWIVKVGAALFGAGFLLETTADLQKYFFKRSNPGKFCSVGVWGMSQHPNFFGNLVLWAGIFVMNAPSLVDPLPPKPSFFQRIWRFRRVAVSLLSPLFMSVLFYGQASGSFSNTQEMANAKYGTDPNYQRYTSEVPLIVPKIF